MVNIVIKKIKGNEYLYLVHNVWVNGKSIQKTIKYIGKKRYISKKELECMKRSFNNEDWILNGYLDYLSYQEHAKMKQLSVEYQSYLKNLDKISKEKEKERFLSLFISNSNAIEGSTMTEDETYKYIFEDIVPRNRTKKELVMASNLYKAWNYLELNSKRNPNKNDLFELHKLVNYDIEDSTLGKLKNVQNYVSDILTSSYLFVEDKIDELFVWIKVAGKKVDDFEIAFQSHAQFELIHPFIDGNGRVGRLLLNWLLIRKGLMPFAILKRADYLESLKNAQRGKVEAICKFCYDEYVNQYSGAISFV